MTTIESKRTSTRSTRMLSDAQRRALGWVAEHPDNPSRGLWRSYPSNARGRHLTDEECIRIVGQSLRALERMELIRDGRTIAEDGRTVLGLRWELTEEGRVELAKLTDAERDALWGFLYASTFNHAPGYVRPVLTKREYGEIAAAESRRRARGPMKSALVERLTKAGLIERGGASWLITDAGRTLLEGSP